MNRFANLMPAGKIIKFVNQCNMKTLHSPNKLVNKMDLQKNTHIVKQKSDLWFELRNKCRVSGSTLYTSKGVDTVKRQKED